MLILVTGGSASGKSEYAENLLPGNGERVYLATMEPFGREAGLRIARHRKLREGKGFLTIECPVNIRKCMDSCRGRHVLLEDLPNLVANEIFSPHGAGPSEIADAILDLAEISESLICVTGILTADGRNYDESTMKYLEELAGIERILAEHAGRVIEVADGLENELKSDSVAETVAGKDFAGIKEDFKSERDAGRNPEVIKEEQREHTMIFITGPMFSGKRNFIRKALNISEEELEERAVCSVQDLVCDPEISLEALTEELALKDIVIADEIGCGVVPLDKSERVWRERAGRLACMLADRADTVMRVVCGCPQILKGSNRCS